MITLECIVFENCFTLEIVLTYNVAVMEYVILLSMLLQ